MEETQLPDIEAVSELVHNAWWEEKKKQGFHAPKDCTSEAHKVFLALTEKEKRIQYGDPFDHTRHKWCEKCHPNMYPYKDLNEKEKDLDRATVRSVYDAIRKSTKDNQT